MCLFFSAAGEFFDCDESRGRFLAPLSSDSPFHSIDFPGPLQFRSLNGGFHQLGIDPGIKLDDLLRGEFPAGIRKLQLLVLKDSDNLFYLDHGCSL